MNRSARKIPVGAINNEGGIQYVVRADIVSDIDNVHVCSNSQDHAFHDSDEGVCKSKVRCERYNHGLQMRRVYLDSNATTPMRPEVVAAMMPVFTEHFGNASSIHWFGQHAKT